MLDVHMPGYGFADTLTRMQAACASVAILVFSAVTDLVLVRLARKLGARAYLLKTEATTRLVSTIRAVADSAFWYTHQTWDTALTGVTHAYGDWDLTPRAVEVLEALARGLTNKQIAAHLHLSVSTIKNCTVVFYDKIGVTSRTAAVLWAIEPKNADVTA